MARFETVIPVDDFTFIQIDDTMGAMEAKFSAHTVDPVGCGSGDTVADAARSLVECIRREADKMEAAIDEWEEIKKMEMYSNPARALPGHCNRCGCDIESNKAGHELKHVKIDDCERILCRCCVDELVKEGYQVEWKESTVY